MLNYRVANRALACTLFGYAIYYQNVSPNPIHNTPLGFFKHLTYWDLLLQYFYFNLVLFASDCLKIKSLERCYSTIFYSLVFPVGLFVSVAFWYLKLFQHDMLFPPGVEKYYPTWHQHCTHTFVLICPLLELLANRFKPPPRKHSLLLLTAFMAAYCTTIFSLGYRYNLWPYPIFRVLTWPQRVVFILASHCLCIGAYFLGTTLNSKL